MKAPDKIYIDDLAVVNNCVTKISLKQLPNFSEYIRKESLLELIESARHSAIVHRHFNDCPVQQEARIDAYDYIKHKIE